MTAALLSGIVISVVRSRHVARHARVVARRLEGLVAGAGTPEFPETSLSELDSIAQSATMLHARLEKESGLRRQWALDVAHDLRTPITGLRVQLEGLSDGVLVPTRARYASILDELSRGFLDRVRSIGRNF